MTSTPAAPRATTRRQDPDVKHNPYAANYVGEEFLREFTADVYMVLSASGGKPYETLIATSPDNPEYDRCTCQAAKRCWHRDAARLRRLIDRETRASQCFYATWTLDLLIDEDARLRAVLADTDSWLVRAQYGVVADAILDRMNRREAA